jgi:hypothetical protein
MPVAFLTSLGTCAATPSEIGTFADSVRYKAAALRRAGTFRYSGRRGRFQSLRVSVQ